jgi:glutathione-specific gamma-glutamylcyclotransferase
MTDSDDLLPERVIITREGLADGSLLARVRAHLLPGMVVRSDAEIQASLDEMLASHDPTADVWVFGYGSLMWNPAFTFAEQRVGVVRGLHRRFCLWIDMGRGSPEKPGLMLALDHGGTCRGIAFRIPAKDVRSELLIIWRREMFGTAYQARWVQVRMVDTTVPAITFVVNRAYPRYAGKLSDAEAAAHIATATGVLGSCMSYLDNTMAHLHSLGIRDVGLERIVALTSGDERKVVR